MAIDPTTDIKLLESERLNDDDNGGGRRTSRVIVSDEVNNLFGKISRADTVIGRFNMRKAYVAVLTALQEVYGGVHIYQVKPPEDPKVSFSIFSTDSSSDTRADARDRLENYITKGPRSTMELYGDHYINQQTMTVYQRVADPIPEIASVFCLSIEDAAYTAQEQFVSITDILLNQVRTFSTSSGREFTRRVLTFSLSQRLEFDFPGTDEVVEIQNASPTVVRLTNVQDAVRIYGISAVSGAVAATSLALTVASVYQQLVPTTTRESGVSLAKPISSEVKVAGASAAATIPIATPELSGGSSMRLEMPIMPGSLNMYGTGYRYADDGLGYLIYITPNAATRIDGSIDYENALITADKGYAIRETISHSYIPAVVVSHPSHNTSDAITLATRGTIYLKTLLPLPAPETLRISYRAMGKWYVLSDDGNGRLAGTDASYGSGTIDYASGALTISLGALPDVGSSIIYQWGTKAHYQARTAAEVTLPSWTHQGAHTHWVPGSVSLTWDVGGVVKTATDDGAGNLTGDASGRVAYERGQLYAVPGMLPAPGTTPSLSYNWLDTITDAFTPNKDGNGLIAITTSQTPIKPGSIAVQWATTRAKSMQELINA